DDLDTAQHARQLLPGCHVDLGEGTVPVLLGRRVDDGEAARFPEHPQESDGFATHAPEFPPFLDDERPADDRKNGEAAEDDLGDGACGEYELRDATAAQVRVSWHSALLR